MKQATSRLLITVLQRLLSQIKYPRLSAEPPSTLPLKWFYIKDTTLVLIGGRWVF